MDRRSFRLVAVKLTSAALLGLVFFLSTHGVMAQDNVQVEASNLGFRVPTLGDVLTFFIRFFFVIAGLVALIYLLLGAFAWTTSAGDKEAVTAAREKITNAIIGVILIVAVLAVIVTLEQIVFQRRVCFGISCTATIPGLIKTCMPAPDKEDYCCTSGYVGYQPSLQFKYFDPPDAIIKAGADSDTRYAIGQVVDPNKRVYKYPKQPSPNNNTYIKQCCYYAVATNFSIINPFDTQFCSYQRAGDSYLYQQ